MIEVKNLTKFYGNHLAVKNLSFTVENGQVYGFLGPNGAGKSTTMNIITGCLAASEGQVLINGHDIFEQPFEAKKFIGYLPEQPPLYLDMTPAEYLAFVGEAKGIAKSELPKQINSVLEQTRTLDVKDRLIKHLSKGYRQRVGIAQALIGDPETIILDEPTVGLDPKQIIEIRDLIRELGKKHTVILSSHILSEVSAICTRILIIAHGRLVAEDTPENLEKMFSRENAIILKAKGSAEAALATLRSVPYIKNITRQEDNEPGTVVFKVEGEDNRDIREQLFFAFASRKLPLLSMQAKHASLEEIFLDITSRPPVDDEPEPESQPEVALSPFSAEKKVVKRIVKVKKTSGGAENGKKGDENE